MLKKTSALLVLSFFSFTCIPKQDSFFYDTNAPIDHEHEHIDDSVLGNFIKNHKKELIIAGACLIALPTGIYCWRHLSANNALKSSISKTEKTTATDTHDEQNNSEEPDITEEPDIFKGDDIVHDNNNTHEQPVNLPKTKEPKLATQPKVTPPPTIAPKITEKPLLVTRKTPLKDYPDIDPEFACYVCSFLKDEKIDALQESIAKTIAQYVIENLSDNIKAEFKTKPSTYYKYEHFISGFSEVGMPVGNQHYPITLRKRDLREVLKKMEPPMPVWPPQDFIDK